MPRIRLFFLGMTLTVLAVACGSTPSASPETAVHALPLYVGQLEGTDARIALVRDDARWAAYVCGGPATFTRITTWFEGAVPDRDELTATSEGKAIQVTMSDAAASGAVTVDGADKHFVAARVEDGSRAGLFQTVDSGCRTGLIVPPPAEGDPQGVYCANADATGRPIARIFEQVTPVLPLRMPARAIPVRVLIASEEKFLNLAPVNLPLPEGL